MILGIQKQSENKFWCPKLLLPSVRVICNRGMVEEKVHRQKKLLDLNKNYVISNIYFKQVIFNFINKLFEQY